MLGLFSIAHYKNKSEQTNELLTYLWKSNILSRKKTLDWDLQMHK